MENLNYNYENNPVAEDDFNEYSYGEPEMQNEGISEEEYVDSYNFYPDAGF